MSRSLAIALSCGLILCTTAAMADTVQQQFQDANGKYWDKNYSESRKAYEDIIERYKIQNPVLRFNQGNCSYELGELGWAVLHFKRALALNPNEALEKKIRHNLNLTNEALIERHRRDIKRNVTVLDESHGVAYSLFHLLSSNQIASLFGLLWVALFVVLIARRFVGVASEAKRALKATAIALIILTLITGTLFAGNVLTRQTVVRGIIVEDNVQMRDGRHPDAPASDVPEGLEVRIIDSTDPNETRVQLSNGKEGWVKASAVTSI